jgi:hypothetical protein
VRQESVDEASLPDAIRAAVSRVRADIQSTTEVDWDWTFENEPDPVAPAVLCRIGSARGAFGVMVRWDADEEEAAAYLADGWSDEVCEILAYDDAERARRWPPCPLAGHDHALDPEMQEERAVWVCRQDRTLVALVGELGRR